MNVTLPVQGEAAATRQNNTRVEDRTSLTSDYEMFLQMLTTQMTNQDPLNPVDSSDYAVQLATFSSVEQQVLTNELLLDLTAELSASGLSDMAGYVGREVKTKAPAYFDGTPIDVIPDVAMGSDAAILKVRNEAGDVVQEFELDPKGGGVTWAGVDDSGRALPAGLYSFEVTSFAKGEELGQSQADSYSRIVEAQTSASGLELILAGGVAVTPRDITGMRN